jgi:hypothetical protein
MLGIAVTGAGTATAGPSTRGCGTGRNPLELGGGRRRSHRIDPDDLRGNPSLAHFDVFGARRRRRRVSPGVGDPHEHLAHDHLDAFGKRGRFRGGLLREHDRRGCERDRAAPVYAIPKAG